MNDAIAHRPSNFRRLTIKPPTLRSSNDLWLDLAHFPANLERGVPLEKFEDLMTRLNLLRILAVSTVLAAAPILSACSDSSDKSASQVAAPVRAASETSEAKIVTVGPNPVSAGVPFNVQPNGQSAIWLKLDRPIAAGSRIVLAGRELETATNAEDGLASPVPPELTGVKGTFPLYVVTRQGAEEFRSATIDFVVE